MNRDPVERAVLSLRGESYEFAVVGSPIRAYAVLEELCFVRREAQAEADLAYADWRAEQSRNAYAVYRAAQDRADAAQDDLASWVRQIATSCPGGASPA
jgi:hypothetical protein